MFKITIINNINDNEVLYEYNNENLDIYNDIIEDLEVKSENIKKINYYLIEDELNINLESIKNEKIKSENLKIFLEIFFIDDAEDSIDEDLGSKIKVYIKTHSGKTIVQEIHTNDTVLELKNLIKDKLDDFKDKEDYSNLRMLISPGQVIENDKTLAFYNINDESTIHLVIPLSGGGAVGAYEPCEEAVGAAIAGYTGIGAIGAAIGGVGGSTRGISDGLSLMQVSAFVVKKRKKPNKIYGMNVSNSSAHKLYGFEISSKSAIKT